MSFIFSKLFWGIFLLGFGVVLILEKVMRINIPFGRFMLAFILIYAGIYLLLRQHSPKKVHIPKQVYANVNVSNDNGKEYNVVFGSNVIDLTQHNDFTNPIKVNTVFGESEVYLKQDETYELQVNTVFGETILPNQKESSIGTNHFIIGDKDKTEKIQVEINTVFGNTRVMVKSG